MIWSSRESNTRMRMLCPHCIIENDRAMKMYPELLNKHVIWVCPYHVQFFPDMFFDFKPLFLVYDKEEFKKKMIKRGVIKKEDGY